MKTCTQTEAFELLKPLWPDATIKVTMATDRDIRAEVFSMYDAPGLGFKKLMEVAKLFGTLNINTENDINNPGCETCDYGSAYGFTLLIRPEEAGDL